MRPVPRKTRFYIKIIVCLCCPFTVSAAHSLTALYATLDPSSVAQHFAFYELYPKTTEGQKALHHAWMLLSQNTINVVPELTLPTLDLQPILSLVHRNGEQAPSLEKTHLSITQKLARNLGNRKLKGFGLWNLGEIIQLPPEEIDLGRTLLLAEMEASPDLHSHVQNYEALLDMMALQIAARLKPNASPLDKVRAINDYIFAEMRFRFPPHSLYAKDIDVYTFLPSVLDSRRGVCLGVSILYLCLAQRLELPLQAITPPGHIYVRYLDPSGAITNIETTARGIDVPTEYYLGIETKELQVRTIREVVGLAFMNQAALYWHKDDPKTAVSLYEKARPFLGEDYLLQLFLGFNYLFIGQEKEGKKLLQKIRSSHCTHLVFGDTIAADYLSGYMDADAIKTVFLPVNETRSSILEKQQKLFAVVQKFPKFRQGIFHLAITWMQLGREKEAIPLLERYMALDASDPTVNYYLSSLYLQRHNFNQAWHYLHNAEEILHAQNHKPKALTELKKTLKRQCPEK